MIFGQTHKVKLSLIEQGFTLVELMLAMSLGLILTIAAFQLFTHSTLIQLRQLSVSEVQDAAVFGFSSLNNEIAHANLGASSPMRQQSAWTGIVLTASNNSTRLTAEGIPLKTGNLRGVQGIDPKFLTRKGAGPSNLVKPTRSDQLTIQYRAPFDRYDCEGRSVNQGDIVIERYFTRLDFQRAKNETKALAIVLACDAGSYQLMDSQGANDITVDRLKIKNFGDNGVVIINRVDYLSIMLGVQLEQGMAYMPIDTYLSKGAASSSVAQSSSSYLYDAPIVAIQIGIIARGNSSIGSANLNTVTSIFSLNGNDLQIKQIKPNYIRRSLQSVVTLRNSHNLQ